MFLSFQLSGGGKYAGWRVLESWRVNVWLQRSCRFFTAASLSGSCRSRVVGQGSQCHRRYRGVTARYLIYAQHVALDLDKMEANKMELLSNNMNRNKSHVLPPSFAKHRIPKLKTCLAIKQSNMIKAEARRCDENLARLESFDTVPGLECWYDNSVEITEDRRVLETFVRRFTWIPGLDIQWKRLYRVVPFMAFILTPKKAFWSRRTKALTLFSYASYDVFWHWRCGLPMPGRCLMRFANHHSVDLHWNTWIDFDIRKVASSCSSPCLKVQGLLADAEARELFLWFLLGSKGRCLCSLGHQPHQQTFHFAQKICQCTSRVFSW